MSCDRGRPGVYAYYIVFFHLNGKLILVRTPAIDAALQHRLTQERLEKYLVSSGNDLNTALALYERNTRLAEAFYTPLQCLEVCIRNAMHDRLSAAYGVDWYNNGAPPFQHEANSLIAAALAELSKTGKPIRPGRVVAELRYAFWVGIVGRH